MTGLYPVNWAFPDRFKAAEDQNNIKNGLGKFRSSATENVSGMKSIHVHMRQSDEDTTAEILNTSRDVQNASRMVTRITAVFRTKRQITAFLNEFASCSVCQRFGPEKNFIATRSSNGAPYGWIISSRTPKNWWRKITQGRRTTEAQRSSSCRKIGKEGEEVCSEGVIMIHIASSWFKHVLNPK